jgi:hypothetical protein
MHVGKKALAEVITRGSGAEFPPVPLLPVEILRRNPIFKFYANSKK